MNKLILASQSPRRKEILSSLGVKFEVIPSSFEEYLDENEETETLAKKLALGKALSVAEKYPNDYVIGSDTIVLIHKRQMEKPKDIEEAREMLLTLTQDVSFVITGVAIVHLAKEIQLIDASVSSVYFKKESPEIALEREKYLASFKWKDKAGGYGIQDGSAALIDHYEGSYTGIIGLPVEILSPMLESLGFPLHT